METVAAGSAGVEVKQVVNGVVDDLENVGVPRDEDFRAQRLDPRYGLRGVVAGIAADVVIRTLTPSHSKERNSR